MALPPLALAVVTDEEAELATDAPLDPFALIVNV
jgi:hypothetical protein